MRLFSARKDEKKKFDDGMIGNLDMDFRGCGLESMALVLGRGRGRKEG